MRIKEMEEQLIKMAGSTGEAIFYVYKNIIGMFMVTWGMLLIVMVTRRPR